MSGIGRGSEWAEPGVRPGFAIVLIATAALATLFSAALGASSSGACLDAVEGGRSSCVTVAGHANVVALAVIWVATAIAVLLTLRRSVPAPVARGIRLVPAGVAALTVVSIIVSVALLSTLDAAALARGDVPWWVPLVATVTLTP